MFCHCHFFQIIQINLINSQKTLFKTSKSFHKTAKTNYKIISTLFNNNERNNINIFNNIYFRLPKPRLPRTRPRVLTPILIKGCVA